MAGVIRIRIGASIDVSVERAFASVEARAKKAEDRIRQSVESGAKAQQKAADKSADGQVRQHQRVKNEAEKSARAQALAAQRLEREQVRVAERAATARERAEQRAARAAEVSANKSIRATEKAARADQVAADRAAIRCCGTVGRPCHNARRQSRAECADPRPFQAILGQAPRTLPKCRVNLEKWGLFGSGVTGLWSEFR